MSCPFDGSYANPINDVDGKIPYVPCDITQNLIPGNRIQGKHGRKIYNCYQNIPSMTTDSTLLCCADPTKAASLNGGTLVGYCAPGYCPGGNNCEDAMAKYCSVNWLHDYLNTPGQGADYYCPLYLNQATSNKDPSVNSAVTNVMGAVFDAIYPTRKYDYVNKGNDLLIANCNLNDATRAGCGARLNGQNSGNLCTGVTREQVMQDETLRELCGCWMAGTDTNYPMSGKGIGIECDAVCNMGGQKYQPIQTERQCKQTVCIMDNISLNIAKNNGKVTFENMCGGNCGKGECGQCYISNDVIDIVKNNGNINLVNNCNTCVVFDESNPLNSKTVNCKSLSGGGGGNGIWNWLTSNPYWDYIKYLLILLIVIIIIALLVMIIKK